MPNPSETQEKVAAVAESVSKAQTPVVDEKIPVTAPAPEPAPPADQLGATELPGGSEERKTAVDRKAEGLRRERIRPTAETGSAKVVGESESVQRAKFSPLYESERKDILGKIDYLKDVDLEASVELGNAVITVEKVLSLGIGSIIELNQMIGDPVRLLINGNPYAYGEVVVIGEKFGIRITKLIFEES